ncbi:hypothetical protein KSP39_PZI015786 [Platanthera zijinensis]|uniref:ARM repeat superfamily protein n=1 Tax=Platanthera zijinensis TaxID=2320716 RepID=A0AAP0BA89_9ASPA
MVFSVVFSSHINLFFHNHFHRCHLHRPEIRVSVRRSRHPRVSPALGRAPRESSIPITAAAGDGGTAEVNPDPPTTSKDTQVLDTHARGGEGYIDLFVQMLGPDNNPLDRDHAVMTLWKYSDGGKDSIDSIMMFPSCVNLVLRFLKSDNPSTTEAAAGLLRNISSVNMYRDILAESGVIEEISWLLHQSFLTIGVKEQSLCTLWNLSIDENHRHKIARRDLLQLLIKLLDDEEIKVKEASGGVLTNLSLSPCYHSIMVEAGVIPKLADILRSDAGGSRIIRKAAKTVLLELSKDDIYRILVIENGLIRVPLIGAASYKSFRSQPHSWPSLPDGTELERTLRPSRYGATDLLLGLTVREKSINLDEAKTNAIVGRSQQQFLARIGAIELDDGRREEFGSSSTKEHTLLSWMDGVARLVLLLGLEDVSAITRAAQSIADASICDHLRISFREAGAVKCLVHLLSHDDKAVQEAVVRALDRLSVSDKVRKSIEAEGATNPLFSIIRHAKISERILEKAANIPHQIVDPEESMERKVMDE